MIYIVQTFYAKGLMDQACNENLSKQLYDFLEVLKKAVIDDFSVKTIQEIQSAYLNILFAHAGITETHTNTYHSMVHEDLEKNYKSLSEALQKDYLKSKEKFIRRIEKLIQNYDQNPKIAKLNQSDLIHEFDKNLELFYAEFIQGFVLQNNNEFYSIMKAKIKTEQKFNAIDKFILWNNHNGRYRFLRFIVPHIDILELDCDRIILASDGCCTNLQVQSYLYSKDFIETIQKYEGSPTPLIYRTRDGLEFHVSDTLNSADDQPYFEWDKKQHTLRMRYQDTPLRFGFDKKEMKWIEKK